MWVVLPGREAVVSRLRAKAKACSELYLATDEDREGEAISWHLLDLLNPDASRTPVHRVIFHESTPGAVGAGLENPRWVWWVVGWGFSSDGPNGPSRYSSVDRLSALTPAKHEHV